MKKQQKFKLTAGIIARWVFSCLFILNGLGFIILGAYFFGLLVVIFALLLFPPLEKRISGKYHVEFSTGFRWLIAIFILIFYYSGFATITTDEIGQYSYEAPYEQEVGISEEIPAEVPKTKVYPMNQEVNVDEISYKAAKAETFREMGATFLKKETDGKFVKIYLDIKNNGKETQQIFTSRFTLVDNQERKYDRLSDDILYISEPLQLGVQLQPGLSTSGAIVFELPKDSEDLILIIRGDWLSTSEIKIALSKIVDIGKDTTLQQEQEKTMGEVMEQAQKETKELLNKCNSPFVCTSSCPEYMDVGQKDCSSGQVCCLE